MSSDGDDELPTPPHGLDANTGRHRRAAQEWDAVQGVRARLSEVERLRGPLTVRQSAPDTWTIDGPYGPAATTATRADAELICHAARDLVLLIHRLLDRTLGEAPHRVAA